MKHQIMKWFTLWGCIVLIITGTAVTQTAFEVFARFSSELLTDAYINGTMMFRGKVLFWFLAYVYSAAFRAAFALWWYWVFVAIAGVVAWYGAKD